MVNELKNYLNDGDEIVYAFFAACDSMADTKFVMAERRMNEILLFIASSTVLHKIVANAAKGFDFKNSFAAARIKTGHVTSLLTPVPRNEQIAFAINLLYAFDGGAVKFREFLEEYYFTGNGITFAFASFVRNVIAPLRNNVEAEFRILRADSAGGQYGGNAKVTHSVYAAVGELKRYIELEPAITQAEREELFTFANALQTALADGKPPLARNIFNTMRNIATTLPLSKSFVERENELDAALAEFGA